MVVYTVVTTTVTTDSPTSVSAEDTSSTVAGQGSIDSISNKYNNNYNYNYHNYNIILVTQHGKE